MTILERLKLLLPNFPSVTKDEVDKLISTLENNSQGENKNVTNFLKLCKDIFEKEFKNDSPTDLYVLILKWIMITEDTLWSPAVLAQFFYEIIEPNVPLDSLIPLKKLADSPATFNVSEFLINVGTTDIRLSKAFLNALPKSERYAVLTFTFPYFGDRRLIESMSPNFISEILTLLPPRDCLKVLQFQDRHGYRFLPDIIENNPTLIQVTLNALPNKMKQAGLDLVIEYLKKRLPHIKDFADIKKQLGALSPDQLYDFLVADKNASFLKNISPANWNDILTMLSVENRFEILKQNTSLFKTLLLNSNELITFLKNLPPDKRISALALEDNGHSLLVRVERKLINTILKLLPEEQRSEALMLKNTDNVTVLEQLVANDIATETQCWGKYTQNFTNQLALKQFIVDILDTLPREERYEVLNKDKLLDKLAVAFGDTYLRVYQNKSALMHKNKCIKEILEKLDESIRSTLPLKYQLTLLTVEQLKAMSANDPDKFLSIIKNKQLIQDLFSILPPKDWIEIAQIKVDVKKTLFEYMADQPDLKAEYCYIACDRYLKHLDSNHGFKDFKLTQAKKSLIEDAQKELIKYENVDRLKTFKDKVQEGRVSRKDNRKLMSVSRLDPSWLQFLQTIFGYKNIYSFFTGKHHIESENLLDLVNKTIDNDPKLR
ncbi:MAG: hypothetical protein Q8R83_10250 [Legionellaceae bacterium]|nr:hypothetical protein [Legionellaceae bacterium]